MNNRSCLAVLLLVTIFSLQLFSQQPDTRPAGLPTDLNGAAYALRAEEALLRESRTTSPVGEGIFQRFVWIPKLGYEIAGDWYVLGRTVLTGMPPYMVDLIHFDRDAAGVKPNPASPDYARLLEGLLYAMTPDMNLLSTSKYDIAYAGQAFVGAIRCIVYTVTPKDPATGFQGRIYVEPRQYNIVRFTGKVPKLDNYFSSLRHKDSHFSVDSWRVQKTSDRWLPAFAYVEEIPPLGAPSDEIVRGQIRFWGYNNAPGYEQQSLTSAELKESSTTRTGNHGIDPISTQRARDDEAEKLVLERLRRAQLIGPAGEVEKALEQIVENLVVSNKLSLARKIRCRVLLVTRFEAFTINSTIVLSRGAIDALSEPALALVLGHQLAHRINGDLLIDSRLASPEVLEISDQELIARLRFQHTPREEQAADKRANELVRESPYKDAMTEAGTVMAAIHAHELQLSHLLSITFGEHLADTGHVVSTDDMFRVVPIHVHELSAKASAVPLGAKLLVNPWNNTVEFYRSEIFPDETLPERAEFAVTPFRIYLEYVPEKTLPLIGGVISRRQAPKRPLTRQVQPQPAAKKQPEHPERMERAAIN